MTAIRLVAGRDVAQSERRATIKAVSDTIQTDAENLKGRIAWALMPLTGKASTDVALARSKAELYAIATALQKLARRL